MPKLDKSTRFHLWYVVAAVVGFILLQTLLHEARQAESISYSEFEQKLKDGKVSDLVILPDYIEGTLKDDSGASHAFVTARVDPLIAGELAKSGVTLYEL